MKGLIPAAGKGTRLRPFTRAYPKELLPVGEKAVIEHVIERFKAADIYDICVVVGWKQHAILDYLGSGEEFGVQLTYVVQDERNGLASAVKSAEHVMGDETFVTILGDNYLTDIDVAKKLVDKHESRQTEATIGAFEVDDPEPHGIINPADDETVIDLVEKPDAEEAPSNLGIAGVYVFEPDIFDVIENIGRGAGNEYQLTDAINELGAVAYREIDGEHVDVGTPERLAEANHR